MTPDAIGLSLRDHGIVHCSGPGNGKFESLLVARKYGLRHSFELMPWDTIAPLTSVQQVEFEESWTRQVEYVRDLSAIWQRPWGIPSESISSMIPNRFG